MGYRRRFSRFLPDDPEAWLTTTKGLRLRGEVVNESYGGIGVTVDDPTGLEEGLEVDIHFAECQFEAVVTSLRRQDDGRYLVGIKWIEPEGDEDEEDAAPTQDTDEEG